MKKFTAPVLGPAKISEGCIIAAGCIIISAASPMAVLKLPEVLLVSAATPIPELNFQLYWQNSTSFPLAVLSCPVLLFIQSCRSRWKYYEKPLVLFISALLPGGLVL